MQYLTDVIGDDYKNWEKGFIFFNAGAGCGKTYFILNVLTKYANENGKTVLLLVNRSALKNQLIHMLEETHEEAFNIALQDAIDTFPDEELPYILNSIGNCYTSHTDYEKDFPFLNLTLLTYQKYEELILKKNVSYYDYIICDEAHYFFNDSTFSASTFVSYEYIMSLGKHKKSTVILMSATAWYLEHILSSQGYLLPQNTIYI